MGKLYARLDDRHKEFIGKQKVFFVATAPREGRINVSPKGMDTFRIFDDQTVGYLDLTGSGAETCAHVLENGRLTLMFCSFDAEPKILRLYGQGQIFRPGSQDWEALWERFTSVPGQRQIIQLRIDSLQTSCGFGVPRYEFLGQRDTLKEWADRKGQQGIEAYWRERNSRSIDDLPTELGESGSGQA